MKNVKNINKNEHNIDFDRFLEALQINVLLDMYD